MIRIARWLIALKWPQTARDCTRSQCDYMRVGTIHYHWGWGQRHESLTPRANLPYCHYHPWVRR